MAPTNYLCKALTEENLPLHSPSPSDSLKDIAGVIKILVDEETQDRDGGVLQ